MEVGRGLPGSVVGLPKTRGALLYAGELHAGQSRDADGAPFILHPREVAGLLYRAGASDDVIAAGVLHDVIEKTPARARDLRRRFGGPITTLVLAVSEDERVASYEARKAALRTKVAGAGAEALMIFAADKISKARELRLGHDPFPTPLGNTPRERPTRSQKLMHYRRCLTLLQEHLPGSPLVGQLDEELESLAVGMSAAPALSGAE